VPELTVSVDVAIPPELRVRLAGLTDAVNPVPAETERETVPEKPPMLAAVMVDVPEEPATTLRVVALDARVKSDDCETDSVRETECERLPLLPATMIVYEPGVVDPDVVIDRVDAAEPPEVRLEPPDCDDDPRRDAVAPRHLVEQRPARRRQLDAARLAAEELRVELAFQRLDLLDSGGCWMPSRTAARVT